MTDKAGKQAGKGTPPHEEPLPGTAARFDHLAYSDGPKYKAEQDKLRTDKAHYAQQVDRLNQPNPDVEPFAGKEAPKGKDPFRDADLQAKLHNDSKGTNFKGENQSKIKNAQREGNMKSHAMRDQPSGTVYGHKPVHEIQRGKEQEFRDLAKNAITLVAPEKINAKGQLPSGSTPSAKGSRLPLAPPRGPAAGPAPSGSAKTRSALAPSKPDRSAGGSERTSRGDLRPGGSNTANSTPQRANSPSTTPGTSSASSPSPTSQGPGAGGRSR